MANWKLALPAVFALMLAGGAGSPALADDAAPAAGPAQSAQPPARAKAADDSSSGVTLRLQYTGEAAYNTGGLHDGGTYLNNIDAQLGVDAGRVFGWTGGKFLFEGFYNNADSLNGRYVGAFQDPSAIDTEEGSLFRLYQAYYEQKIGGTNLLFGIYDLETEFAVTKPMDIFFNGEYAWNTALDASGQNGPSTYPNTSLAFRVRQRISSDWSVQAAVLDGAPDSTKYPNSNAITFSGVNGALLIGEVDYTPTRTTKVMAGYWNYTGQFDAINQTNSDGTQREVFGSRGGYVGGATRLYSPGGHRGLDVFANLGIAGSTTNEINGSFNVGLTYTGLLEDRPQDKFGIATGVAQAGNAYKQAQIAAGDRVSSYENNFEVTYRAPINDWLTVQPDIQYWIHPGLDPSRKNDLLLMLHFEISHLFDL